MSDNPEAVTGPEYALSTVILDHITSSVRTLRSEFPQESVANIAYEATKTIVRHPDIRSSNRSSVAEIVVYYIKGLSLYYEQEGEYGNDADRYIAAALTVFDLYLEDPNNHTKRKMLTMTVGILRDHIVDVVGNDSAIDGPTATAIATNVTILEKSVTRYVRPKFRTGNLPYIKWIQTLFTEVFADQSWNRLISAEEVGKIINQIKTWSKQIVVFRH